MLLAQLVGCSWAEAAECKVQEVWLILELSPKTLILLVAFCWEESKIQVAIAGQILFFKGRNIMLMIFSTFVHALKVSLEYLWQLSKIYSYAEVLNGIYKLFKKMGSSQWLKVKTFNMANSACSTHCQFPLCVCVCGPSTCAVTSGSQLTYPGLLWPSCDTSIRVRFQECNLSYY